MKAGQISELLEKEGPSGVGNLAAALKHLTFKNSIDNKYYKLEGFGKYDVGQGSFSHKTYRFVVMFRRLVLLFSK